MNQRLQEHITTPRRAWHENPYLAKCFREKREGLDIETTYDETPDYLPPLHFSLMKCVYEMNNLKCDPTAIRVAAQLQRNGNATAIHLNELVESRMLIRYGRVGREQYFVPRRIVPLLEHEIKRWEVRPEYLD
jgi:hypothetical protein